MDKITYPQGEVMPAGTFLQDKEYKFAGGYYSTSDLFSESTEGDFGFNLVTAQHEYVGKDQKKHLKTISVQSRISNNGTLLPHNSTDRYLGPVYWGGYGGYMYHNQRFKLNRNAVPYSPVNEVMVFQADVVNKLEGGKFPFKTYIDYRFYEDGKGKLLDVNYAVLPEAEVSGIVDPTSELDICLNFYTPNGTFLFSSEDHWGSARQEYKFFNIDGNTEVNYRYLDLAVESSQIIENIDNIGYAKGYYMSRYNQARLEFTEELKAAVLTGAQKYKYIYFKIMTANAAGYFEGQGESKPFDHAKAINSSLAHNSDFLPEESFVDPAGDYVILKFNRPTKVDILFNNIAYEYDKFSDANHEIRVNKKSLPFTTGGIITIVQKHKFLSGSYTNRTFTYVVPDTVAPDTPVFGSATRTSVSGGAKVNDIVYLERNNVILGNAKATATNTFEIVLTNDTFDNGDVIKLYTQDTAGNKSEIVEVTLTDISSENKVSLLLNTDIINMAP